MPSQSPQELVGFLLVFSGIGVSILLATVTIYITGRKDFGTEESSSGAYSPKKRESLRHRWHIRLVGSLVFATPFYLASTFLLLIYICPDFQRPFILGLAYWSVVVGTLLLIGYYAYFGLIAVGEIVHDHWYMRKVRRANLVDLS